MADINKLDILLPNSLETNYSSTQQPSVVEGDKKIKCSKNLYTTLEF